MNDLDRQGFADLLTQVYSEYGKDISEFSLNAFWESLKRFDFQAVSHAFHVYYTSPDHGHFAPKPGDIIRILEGGSGDVAMKAWTQVDKAIRQVGPYSTVVFDDPIIHAVISDMGGWIQLGNCSEKDFEFRGKEFAKRYRGYRETGRTDSFPAKLIGISEMHNRKEGFEADEPLLLGNPEQAKRVLLSGKTGPTLKITHTDIVGEINKIQDKRDSA